MALSCLLSFTSLLIVLIIVRRTSSCSHPNRGSKCNFAETFPCCSNIPLFANRTGFPGLVDDLIVMIGHAHPFSQGTDVNIASPDFWDDNLVISLSVYKIFEIDQKKRSFKMHYKFKSSWRDCRTVHNCTWITLDSTHPTFSSFWTPHFRIAELQDTSPHLAYKRLEIDPDGYVIFESEHVSTFGCAFDFEDFPFDSQDCSFTITTPQLPSVGLKWNGSFGKGGIAHTVSTSAEWKVSGWRTEVRVLNREDIGESSYVVSAQLYVRFDRMSSVQIRSQVLPVISFWFASWCGLWVDCHVAPARAAMAVIPLLILTNKMNALAASLPSAASTNVLERYMLVTLGLLSLHLLEFAVVNLALRRERERKDSVTTDQTEDRSIAKSAERFCKGLDWFCIQYLNRNLNMHSRWISLAVFVGITSALFAGHAI